MDPKQTALAAVKALSDKKAKDVRLLATTELTVLADYFVLCTANSGPHLKTLTDEVDRVLSEAGMPPLRREGYRSGNWMLLDFGSVIVHVFQQETRQFYNLEHLWKDAQEVDITDILEG